MYPQEVPHRLASAGQLLLQSRGLMTANRVPPPVADARWGKPWCSLTAPMQGHDELLAAARRLQGGHWRVFGRDVDVHPERLDWNTDPVTGKRLPASFGLLIDFRHLDAGVDIKFLWEINRHAWLVTWAQAWRSTADPVWLGAIAKALQTWLAQCPYPLGPNWSSPIEHGIRLINWSLIWHLAGGPESPLFGGAEGGALRAAWLRSIYQHMRFIADNYSLYSSANNHLIGELAGLYVAARTWDQWLDTRRMAVKAKHDLQAEALKQFSGDGVNAEQAMCYHKFSLHFLLAAGLCGRANQDPFGQPYWDRVQAALVYVASQMDCSGEVPLYGDADDGEVFCLDPSERFSHYRSLVAVGARLSGRSDLSAKHAAVNGGQDVQADWLLGQDAQPTQHPAQQEQDLAGLPTQFAQGGYLILGHRLHQADEVRVLMDVGPLGSNRIAGHGHADALSLQLSIAGVSLLCDPGTYCYNAEPAFRRYFRSTAAHNTLVVDGQDQSLYGGSFLWLRDVNSKLLTLEDDGESCTVHACHDGYTALRDPVTHHRRVTLCRRLDRLVVVDWLDAGQPHDVSLNWHAPSGAVLAPAGDGRWALTHAGRRVTLTIKAAGACSTAVVRGQAFPVRGWQSTQFYQRAPADSLNCDLSLRSGQELTTVVQW